MEHFEGLTLDEIGYRYKHNQYLLCQHLMEAGLLKNEAQCEKCKTRMVHDTANPWKWRCPTKCNNRQSVITEHCFLNSTRKYYNVFVAMYMWLMEYPMKIIIRESELSRQNISELEFHWREILQLENRNLEVLQGKFLFDIDMSAIQEYIIFERHSRW